MSTKRRRMRDPVILALVFVGLAGVSSINLRTRDPMAAVNNVIDAQVAVEMLAWCGLAGWLGLRALREAERFPLNRPRDLGPSLRAYLPFVLLTALSTLYGRIVPLSIFRAFQLVVLVTFTAWVYGALAGSPERFERFWLVVRRAWWMMCILATALTFALPSWEPFLAVSYDQPRLRWFAGHPVGTASMLGLGVLLLLGGVLGHPDPSFRSRGRRILRNLALLTLIAALLATKSRGALAATAVGVAVMAITSPDRRTRGWLGLTSLGFVAFLATGTLADLINEVVLRQQTTDQLLSLTGRRGLAAAAIPLVREHLWFGHGYQSARFEFLQLAWGAGETHNLLLEVAFSTGLAGLACVLWFCGRFVVLQRRARRICLPRLRGVVRETMAIFAFLLVIGIVEDGFVGSPGSQAIVLMLAMLGTDVALRSAGAIGHRAGGGHAATRAVEGVPAAHART